VSDLPRILIVDDSRVVRVSLTRHLQGHFDIREEGDGEAAWQTLVLDHSIRAVISDLRMPKLNGYELLERLRLSKLRRLQQMPFILVSGEETEEERARACALGVSDFVTKGAGSAEILARLNHLLALSSAQEGLEAGRQRLVQDPESGLYSRKYLELQAAQAMAHAARHGGAVSALVVGFDGYPALVERLGERGAAELAVGVARQLAAKMRREDSLGHFADGEFAIICQGTPAAFAATFAERVRQAVAAARVNTPGAPVALSVSIGLASQPVDAADTAAALLDLAGARMRQAMALGGNRVDAGGVRPASQAMSVRQALELIAAGQPAAVLPHLSALGFQLLPLLQLMNRELGSNLPLAEFEHRLSERKNQ